MLAFGKIDLKQKILRLEQGLPQRWIWKEFYMRYNGDLTVCNMLNPYIYGDCRYYPFEKIWNGLNANMFRFFVNTKFRHYFVAIVII